MSDLLVIEFPSEAKAEGVREMLLAMQKEYLIELGDAVVAMKDEGGRIKLNQLFQPVARATAPRKFWSPLIELIFLMRRTAAASGGWFAELGINDEFIRQVSRTLQSGNAALFVLIRKMTTRCSPRCTARAAR